MIQILEQFPVGKKKGILQSMENLVKEADDTDRVVCLFHIL